jgi:hypothetical protein
MKPETPVQGTLKTFLRALQAGGVLAIVISLLVAFFGLIAGWRTATEYSNGMFAMGSAVIIFGLLAVWGGFTSRGSFQMVYPQSVSDMSLPERARLWMLDTLRGYQIVGVMTVCGALMIGLSVLIYELFG